jgi:hypothetical protein
VRRRQVPLSAPIGEEPPEELLRLRWRPADDPRGWVTPQEANGWLRGRALWRQRHPGRPLPRLDAMTRYFLMKKVERGLIDRDLYAAEQASAAPVREVAR